MRTSRFSEAQIIGYLKEAEAGVPIKELCRRGGFSDATFYKWRAKYGALEAVGCQLVTVMLIKIWVSIKWVMFGQAGGGP